MNFIKSIIGAFIVLMMLVAWNASSTALAADGVGGTFLPATELGLMDCNELIRNFDNLMGSGDTSINMEVRAEYMADREVAEKFLGCGIKTGNIKLWMVPYYIRYILEFALRIGGLIAVGGIIIGGFTLLFAGVSEDKEKGKKAIIYSIIGMILIFSAWTLVNIVIALLTS